MHPGQRLASHPAIGAALDSGTVAIIAGTTNGYVAEEILAKIGQAERFSRQRFFCEGHPSAWEVHNTQKKG